MEKVNGIGGFFFRARDPKSLGKWYCDHLGVAMPSWEQAAGPCAFAPFPESTEYFGNMEKKWMLNFRVSNLDAMVAQLRAGGITVEVDPTVYPMGRFAQLNDPEGNPIQLWQPE